MKAMQVNSSWPFLANLTNVYWCMACLETKYIQGCSFWGWLSIQFQPARLIFASARRSLTADMFSSFHCWLLIRNCTALFAFCPYCAMFGCRLAIFLSCEDTVKARRKPTTVSLELSKASWGPILWQIFLHQGGTLIQLCKLWPSRMDLWKSGLADSGCIRITARSNLIDANCLGHFCKPSREIKDQQSLIGYDW